jgi:AhpC/TSA antioxidant enzyme
MLQPGQPAPLLPASDTRGFHLVIFLRHVGCPFAENTIRSYRQWAAQHPQVQVTAISHGTQEATERWLTAIGGAGPIQVLIDEPRGLYRQWGLQPSGFWHFAGPRSLAGVARLWFSGIFNRPASGTRWQRAGLFLLDQNRRIVWVHVPGSAEGFAWPPASLLIEGD